MLYYLFQIIPQRLQLTDFKMHTERISNVFPYIDEELSSVSSVISECEYISLPHKCIWKYSFSLYISQKLVYYTNYIITPTHNHMCKVVLLKTYFIAFK